jgi:hypothetical protein
MLRRTALRLMKEWIGKRCDHPSIENEFFLGKETGNKVCAVCGRTIYTTVQPKGAQNA